MTILYTAMERRGLQKQFNLLPRALASEVVTGPGLGTFYFEACRWQKEEDESCNGYSQFKGGNRMAYRYAAFGKRNRLSFFLTEEQERED
jgi:hypothetical protein